MSGVVDPFNGHIDEFRIAHDPAFRRLDRDHLEQRDGVGNPSAFAVAGAEEQEGGSGKPPLAGTRVVVCLMA